MYMEMSCEMLSRSLLEISNVKKGSLLPQDIMVIENNPPKVFISHASEDKERFVLSFAERLRTAGAGAWVDIWEIYPGDSLVDKIFEEGLKDAQAIIVVLSEFSIIKPWIREELNAAVIQRIEKGTRLIPIVLDNCAVPEALKTVAWVEVKDLENYEAELQRIVSAIFNLRPKPPIGEPPGYTQTPLPPISNLSKIDILVLKLFCETSIAMGIQDIVPTDRVWAVAEKQGITRQDFIGSLEMLSIDRYLAKSRMVAEVSPYFEITTFGMDAHLSAFFPSYENLCRSVAAEIWNYNVKDNEALASRLNQPQIIVNHILKLMADRQFVTLRRPLFGIISVETVLPRLKRFLQE